MDPLIYEGLEKACQIYQNEVFKNLRSPHDYSPYQYWKEDPIKPLNYLKNVRGVNNQMLEQFKIGFAPPLTPDFIRTKLPEYTNALQEAGLVGRYVIDETSYEMLEMGWEIGNIYEYDHFKCRIMFPLISQRGNIIGFIGRELHPNIYPKYLRTFNQLIDYNSFLYGLNFAFETAQAKGKLFVFEGQLDVILAHENGISNSVSTLGTRFTPCQKEIVHKLMPGVEILIVFDGDDSGRKAATKTNKEFNSDHLIKVYVLPKGKDPDDVFKNGEKIESLLA